MNPIYLIRHCATTGQEPEAPLTVAGEQQALALAAFREIVAAGKTTALVTHGNLTALLLRRLGLPFDADKQARLTNPDVFRVTATESGCEIQRIWGEAK
ncbi:hypothetical protein [Armatimonas sp.]|uniref:hypothetical protein n=1 Tax=Armatimonas sp. TaxID=1872638 RepID=UPI003750DCB6